ncbi:FAD-dependent oxidoreductase [Streptomyces antnestii]|uniref:FAD-dependent oxidoreductase n=1 Tax=Streptomyces antnestii TaxID=2494256 RepID=A0A437P9P0_9ACTN|nr:FAD-binding oxidoreductase [Streptomyces sp. San01]RVU18921.1 FAD-dependent oxidoreductase [Streptomyces sp. San01]
MSTASDTAYRDISLWHDTLPASWDPTPALPGDREFDVAVVGAGYTGLWTAYYLAKRDPGLRICVLEREVAGYGASGRNGGWCSAIFPTSARKIAASAGRPAAVAMQSAMNGTVAEIARVVREEGVDCDFAHGGYVSVARNAAQLARARSEVEHWREWGFGEDHMRMLSAGETGESGGRVRMNGALGGTYTPHCAALHPAKLVRGLADTVRAHGVTVYERTAVTEILPGRLRTEHGTVRADSIVVATEGYTPDLPGRHRSLVPMYSLMVATEPLPQSWWDERGLDSRETFSDKRHLRIYGQRTADGRIAFGGRGAPYHFASRISPTYDRDARVHAMLRSILGDLFPGLDGTRFTHAWGGNLGIPRDWYPSVRYDRGTGIGWAGGYVGDGVATANLAGRTLADLILKDDSDLTALPWVGRTSPRWEPEPLRWLGVNAVTALFAMADRTEARTGKPSRSARTFWRMLGH